MTARLANEFWVASCYPGWRRFSAAAGQVAAAQAKLLSHYLRLNAATAFGLKYKFPELAAPEEYQARVPLSEYESYLPLIEEISNGRQGILTGEPVQMFELSSGSTSACKLIPYTRGLKSEFQRGLSPWIYNLYTHYPQVRSGPAYWSITPLVDGQRFTNGGLPVGFESDSAYLGSLGHWLVDHLMAVPDAVKHLSNINDFRYATLFYLLRQPQLRLLSVWNPTYLLLLLSSLPNWWDSLCKDIAAGACTLPGGKQDVIYPVTPRPELARRLKSISPTDYTSIWPHLTLISCWMDGPSAVYACQLSEQFPKAVFQGKGLLATEGFITFPLVGVEGGVLSVNSHFFEFIDQAGDVWLAHQLVRGRTYSVVITTGGGLYRYQLHDIVEVLGHWKQLPRLRFIGKADHISDWFGEKLEEDFVAAMLGKVFSKHQLIPDFSLLAPDDSPSGFHYVLFLDCEQPIEISSLAGDIDLALCTNFHYHYCRKLGQIQAVEVVPVIDGAQAYLQAKQSQGQKLGNIKPGILDKQPGLRKLLAD
ncbi:MAG: GH3 auxin-responsive promoter family protein [Anaerolineales bacterium]|nr:GH3 auxin-responsive promoter family protein [Anaerolineales bacterium]